MTTRILLALFFTILILLISLLLQKLKPMKIKENDYVRCLGKCDFEEKMVESLPENYNQTLEKQNLVKENKICKFIDSRVSELTPLYPY